MKEKIGIFSFFAGAGFLDLGFEKAGSYEILFVNEYHKAFMEIYKGARANLNIGSPKYGYDVKDITKYNDSEELDSLKSRIRATKLSNQLIGFIGGPPCPDFSIGGKNKGKDGENGKLSGTYIDLICKTSPDFFLFENVKGLYKTAKHRDFFDYLKKKLIKAGYFLTEKLINALEFGAPQDRQRIILIGFHKNLLSKASLDKRYDKLLENFNWNKHIRYDILEILSKEWPTIEKFNEIENKSMPNNVIKELTVQHWFDKNDVVNHPNSNHYFKPKAGLEKFRSISEGDDLKKSYKRLHRWRYSPTAAYGNNEVHLHPYKARRISAAEALAIQSLPKEFIIPSSITLTDMFKSIGNGVPFLAANGLAKTIADFIEYLDSIKVKTEYAEANS